MRQRWMSYGLLALGIMLLFFLIAIKADIDQRDVFLCQAVHESDAFAMTQCPAHTTNTSWYLIGGFIITGFLLALGIYLLFFPLKTTETFSFKKEKKSSLPLRDEEKQIISLLEEHEGSLYQSDIMKETGMSKVKVTRILDRLEVKGLVERKRRGMTNLVVLK